MKESDPVDVKTCPIRSVLRVLGGKWKPIIIVHLMDGKHRFGAIRRLLPDATQKMLTQHLRELEHDGVVARKVYPQVPPKVEYSLTAFGRTLQPLLREMRSWGLAHGARPNTAAGKRKTKVHAR